jgi:hypothetical protein
MKKFSCKYTWVAPFFFNVMLQLYIIFMKCLLTRRNIHVMIHSATLHDRGLCGCGEKLYIVAKGVAI